MPISHPNKIVFVHIPRTAGTNIEKALGICGVDNNGSNEQSIPLLFGFDGNNFLQHLYATEIRERIGHEYFDQCFKFAFVRNPFSRLVSAFENYYRRYGDFNYFVKKIVPKHMRLSDRKDEGRHLKQQSRFVSDEAGNVLVDFIGRQENLQNDIVTLEERIGIKFGLKQKNETRASSYQEYYSDELRRRVESYYDRDLEQFGYSFEQTNPAVTHAQI